MKVTVKTVSDRITILENQKTRSLNEDFQLAVYRWALELKRGAEAAEAQLAGLERDLQESERLKDSYYSLYRTVQDQLAELAKLKPIASTTQCQIELSAEQFIGTMFGPNDMPIKLFTRAVPVDGLDAKRIAFIDSLADNTSTQYDSLRKAEE